LSGGEIIGEVIGQHGDLPFKQGCIDTLSPARRIARDNRHEDADGPEKTAPDIGHRNTRLDRTAAFLAGDTHISGKSLHEDIVGAVLFPGAVRAETADAAIDKSGVQFLELLIADTEL